MPREQIEVVAVDLCWVETLPAVTRFKAIRQIRHGYMWHGVPCPVGGDDAARLRQRLQIDAWRAPPADAERLQQLVSKNAAFRP